MDTPKTQDPQTPDAQLLLSRTSTGRIWRIIPLISLVLGCILLLCGCTFDLFYVDTAVLPVAPSEKAGIEPQEMKSLNQQIFPFDWDRNIFFDISKAKSDFGYRPAFNTEEGMRQTYEWWTEKRGIQGTKFSPGKLGYNVDLAYEDEILARHS